MKTIFGSILLFLMFFPLIVPDSIDNLLKEISVAKIGPYSMELNYVIVGLTIVIFLVIHLSFSKRVSRNMLLLTLLGILLIVIDFWRSRNFAIVFFAYLTILIPLVFSTYFMSFFKEDVLNKVVYYFFKALFYYLSFQAIFLTIFPRKTWVHEVVSLFNIQLYRTITTSGPATAYSYLLIGTFVLFTISKGSSISMIDLYILITSTLLSLTRGAIVIMILTLLFVKDYVHIDWLRLVVTVFTAALIIILIPNLFIARVMQGYGFAGDQYRFMRMEQALSFFFSNDFIRQLFGTGFGTGYTREAVLQVENTFYLASPHNLNLVILNELGIIRFSFFYGVLGLLLYKLRRLPLVFIYVMASIIVTFNTEVVYLYTQYNCVIIFLIVYSLHKIDTETHSSYEAFG